MAFCNSRTCLIDISSIKAWEIDKFKEIFRNDSFKMRLFALRDEEHLINDFKTKLIEAQVVRGDFVDFTKYDTETQKNKIIEMFQHHGKFEKWMFWNTTTVEMVEFVKCGNRNNMNRDIILSIIAKWVEVRLHQYK